MTALAPTTHARDARRSAKSVETAQTLDRGLQILLLLGGTDKGLAAVKITAALGVTRTVTGRLLNTLELRGFVERRRDRFVLGPAVISLGRMVGGDIISSAMPLLEAAAERFDATAVLHVADRGEAVTLASVESSRAEYRMGFRVGARTPLGVAAHGVAILAGGPPRSDERPEVTLARERGYAVTSGEVLPGHLGLASPVWRAGHCEASVGLVVAEKNSLPIDELGRAIKEVADRLSAELGRD